MRRASLLLLLLTLSVGIAASEGIASELSRYQDTCAKLQKSRDDDLAREKARTVANLVTIAKRDQSSGDIAAATPTWKLVIMLDAKNEEARKFLTGINQLDAALTEATNRPDTLLPAPDVPPPTAPKTSGRKPPPILADAPIMDIPADRVVSLGNQRMGSIVIIQYVSGKWTSNIQAIPLQNPDRADDLHPNNHIVLFQNNPNAKFGKDMASFLVESFGNTVAEPLVYKLARDTPNLSLRIKGNWGDGRNCQGEVKYRVKVIPPQ
jgi:hypothetical protein